MLLGQPNEDVWPGYSKLPLVKSLNPIGPPYVQSFTHYLLKVRRTTELTSRFSVLRQRFKQLSSNGHNLLTNLLMYDPSRRPSAEEAVKHPYFE